jgi:hypothetical protein
MIALLLSGCGNAVPERRMEELKQSLTAAQRVTLTADVTANLENEVFSCTLKCSAQPDAVTVEVLAPDSIAGIRAVVDPEGSRIEYADISLGVGGEAEVPAPVTALPLLLTALKGGSTLRTWTERADGRELVVRESYVSDDTSLVVWLDAESLQPLCAEFRRGGTVAISCEITQFTYE